jgi:hypothetical protein
MVNASVVFWTFVILLGFIGASRGWLREVILTFSMVFALFVLNFFDQYIKAFTQNQALTQPYAWLTKALPFLLITIFGYLGPAVAGRTGRAVGNPSGRLEEGLLSTLLGGFNGYIIFSTLAYFAYEVGILKGTGDFRAGTNTLFTAPAQQGGWDSFFFISNSAVTYFSGSTLVLVLIALVLFVLIVVI